MGFVGAFLLLGFFIIFLSVIYTRRQVKNRKEKMRMQSEFSSALLQTQLEIKEQTLQQISTELHDNLGQIASLIKINLNTIQLSDPAKTEEKIEDTKDLTRRLITDLKSLSLSLGSENIIRAGLEKSIQAEVERLNKIGHFTAIFSQEGIPVLLDKDKAVILYRMVQESLNNIIKHSNAKNIHVLLKGEEKLFTLAVNDNGTGFNVNEKMSNGGSGLHNLHNRAKLIGAQLSIQSSPEAGTIITIGLPL